MPTEGDNAGVCRSFAEREFELDVTASTITCTLYEYEYACRQDELSYYELLSTRSNF